MTNWWVNQNQTYDFEVPDGFLWSPKTNKNGVKNRFYDNMTSVKPGDLIFSFCDTKIKAVGVATGPAETADRPNLGSAGESWAKVGWRVPVTFTEVDAKVRPKDFIQEIRPYLAEKYAPLQKNGNGNQGAYLAYISDAFAGILLAKIGKPPGFFTAGGTAEEEKKDDEAQKAIEGRTDIGPTQKQQLVQARRGQGIFKSNVRHNESKCRVTGIADIRLLIAGHIKPWAHSSDKEKLDGCNGLLLSPHVDLLFDRGLISFENNGQLLVSNKLDRAVLDRWAIDGEKNVGPFKPAQCVYLEYHRGEKFQQ
jgi:putative restriction endonuclease